MDIVTKFSFTNRDENVRNIVYKDEFGFYHVDKHITRRESVNETEIREDIHGKMNDQAYIAWLQNIVYNSCYKSAVPSEREWMLSE